MKELTLKYDEFGIDSDIENYLLTLKGIKNAKFDEDKNEVFIEYDPNLITIKLILMEIDLFINTNSSSLFGFDKHSNNKLLDYEIIINDLCCEFCLKGNIEDLILIDGIESAKTDYNYQSNKRNVKISIKYDNNLINIEKIKELEKEFNE